MIKSKKLIYKPGFVY